MKLCVSAPWPFKIDPAAAGPRSCHTVPYATQSFAHVLARESIRNNAIDANIGPVACVTK